MNALTHFTEMKHLTLSFSVTELLHVHPTCSQGCSDFVLFSLCHHRGPGAVCAGDIEFPSVVREEAGGLRFKHVSFLSQHYQLVTSRELSLEV